VRDTFVTRKLSRGLASSLPAYLHTYVAVSLVSVEQLSFMEFSQMPGVPELSGLSGNASI
jgi:flagellar motor switch protein FliM